MQIARSDPILPCPHSQIRSWMRLGMYLILLLTHKQSIGWTCRSVHGRHPLKSLFEDAAQCVSLTREQIKYQNEMVIIAFETEQPINEQLIDLRPFLKEINFILLSHQFCFPIILVLLDFLSDDICHLFPSAFSRVIVRTSMKCPCRQSSSCKSQMCCALKLGWPKTSSLAKVQAFCIIDVLSA